jgi:hypothetical protein
MFTKENLNKERLYYYLLDNLHIQVENWGKGTSKSFESLFSEIENGECIIEAYGVRRIRTVCAEVVSGKFHLVEKRQVFSDGRLRVRKLPFGSLGEKLFFGEEYFLGLNRMFREEVRLDLFRCYRKFSVCGPDYVNMYTNSNSYPGLTTHNEQFRFRVSLDEVLRAKLGENEFVSIEQGKTTYFKWEEIKV